jgi:hypothetical protein
MPGYLLFYLMHVGAIQQLTYHNLHQVQTQTFFYQKDGLHVKVFHTTFQS